jgi:hypothetical protein
MTNGGFRTSAEGFFISSAIFGVMLAALLAQTRVLAFGSFKMMIVVFLAADIIGYITMKAGFIRSPRDWGRAKQ